MASKSRRLAPQHEPVRGRDEAKRERRILGIGGVLAENLPARTASLGLVSGAGEKVAVERRAQCKALLRLAAKLACHPGRSAPRVLGVTADRSGKCVEMLTAIGISNADGLVADAVAVQATDRATSRP